jgi:hypothetical protein
MTGRRLRDAFRSSLLPLHAHTLLIFSPAFGGICEPARYVLLHDFYLKYSHTSRRRCNGLTSTAIIRSLTIVMHSPTHKHPTTRGPRGCPSLHSCLILAFPESFQVKACLSYRCLSCACSQSPFTSFYWPGFYLRTTRSTPYTPEDLPPVLKQARPLIRMPIFIISVPRFQ